MKPFENIPPREQRWQVIMVPGPKSYDSWENMVISENFPDEARQTYKKNRTQVANRTRENPDYIHTMSECGVTVRYRLERTR